jgi:hypothetical protein
MMFEDDRSDREELAAAACAKRLWDLEGGKKVKKFWMHRGLNPGPHTHGS